MRKHLLAITVILTVATGCDNVAWGGIDVEVRPPPAAPEGVNEGDDAASTEDGPVNVDGPILLAGTRDGARASLVVVGELLPEGLSAFPDPRFPEDIERLAGLTATGSTWILFSEGVRVGRLIADGSAPADVFCGDRTEISGVVELVPDAAPAQRFLALSAPDAEDRPYEEFRPIQHVYDQRVATIAIAGEAIPRAGAPWPEGGVLDARDHIHAFQLRNILGQTVAATFVAQDELAVGPPRQGAYALFMLGHQAGAEYREAFTWYRAVDTEGKGAPRYFDHLDWNGDGSDEILLDVFGSNRRWFAVLSQRSGSWVRTFQDACGSGSAGQG
jgi:hypothetical protein